MKTKILLLSGYDAASHQHWRKYLAQYFEQFEWNQLALPARHFAWRTRGSSLSFAFEHAGALKQHYDLLIVTSMVDLASLRGFCPQLSSIPTLLYFHENQFVYPIANQQPNILNAQLTSIYSALCADKVVFNSEYNRSSFFAGALQLFKRLPDININDLLARVQSNSAVLPVPIHNANSLPNSRFGHKHRDATMSILWNHRWEYDKQPQVFFAAMRKLKAAGQDFRLHVLGQSFRQVPACFAAAKEEFANEIVHWGYQPQAEYQAIMGAADWVVSSALHDFQGLSMLEAIAAGCVPIAPKRVAYPEYLSSEYCYEVGVSEAQEADNLFRLLHSAIQQNSLVAPNVSRFYGDALREAYVALFAQLMEKQR